MLYARGLRSACRLSLPDFLGIGAQKAGTTWLHENLRKHPQLFLPEEKELHYFDWHYHEPLRSYALQFERANGRVKGEITPGYATLTRERIAFVHRLMPAARLILLLRNPIDRAWSQALMNLVTRPERAYEDVDEGEFRAHFESARSVLRGDYLATIDSWLSYYRPEQLYVGFYEDVSERPRELLKEVFAHLGVSTEVEWKDFPYEKVVHRGAGRPLPGALRAMLADMYRDDLDRLVQRFGQRAERWQAALTAQ